MVPPIGEEGNFEMPIEGQLYFPATSGGAFHPETINLPLVVIVHGFWPSPIDSFKGYNYLAEHLVQWGMLVFSLNMNKVPFRGQSEEQFSRGEIILETIKRMLRDVPLTGKIDSQRIGLIGHSVGGEGVVVAQLLNESQNRGFHIKGVVSIAPTHHRPDVTLRGTKYMQIYGSLDYLTNQMTGPDTQAIYSGFRIYDRAWRPKTLFWIYGARHNPFNREWLADINHFDVHPLALPPDDHERIAKCLINAFFQDALLDQIRYAGYMEGIILPQSLLHLEIHTQHSQESRTVLDNFGDVDQQAHLGAQSLDKTTNSQGQQVRVSGRGLVQWEDVEHTSLAHSPHNTKGVQLAWNRPDVIYLSSTGGVSISLTDVFALRVGQFHEDAVLNPITMPIDLFVSLSDGLNEATLRLGSVAQVPYPDTRRFSLCPMRTMRLPLDAFQTANPALRLNSIQSISIRLTGRATGNILIDDIEFSI